MPTYFASVQYPGIPSEEASVSLDGVMEEISFLKTIETGKGNRKLPHALYVKQDATEKFEEIVARLYVAAVSEYGHPNAVIVESAEFVTALEPA